MQTFKSLQETVSRSRKNRAREIILAHKSSKERISKIAVLVEGIDDPPLYSHFIDKAAAHFYDCEGCCKAERTSRIIREESKMTFITILDSDFKRLDGKLSSDSNIFYTDYHDSELLMFSSIVLKKSLFKDVLGKKSRYVELEARLEEELFNISMIKWFNMRRNLNFRFEDIDWFNVSRNMQIPLNAALSYFKPTSPKCKIFPFKAFNTFLFENKDVDRRQITNGHDLIGRLSAIYKNDFGHQISHADLRDRMCYLYTTKMAKSTTLYKELQNWCVISGRDILLK